MHMTLRQQPPLHAWIPMVVAAMLALAVLTSPFAAAQEKGSQAAHDAAGDVTDMQALRAAVKADKHAYVASTLALTSGTWRQAAGDGSSRSRDCSFTTRS